MIILPEHTLIHLNEPVKMKKEISRYLCVHYCVFLQNREITTLIPTDKLFPSFIFHFHLTFYRFGLIWMVLKADISQWKDLGNGTVFAVQRLPVNKDCDCSHPVSVWWLPSALMIPTSTEANTSISVVSQQGQDWVLCIISGQHISTHQWHIPESTCFWLKKHN